MDIHNRILRGVKQTPSGCLEWLGHLSDRGYGLMKIGGRQVKAHRVSYELYMGEIPAGMEVHHLCENKRCVNPRHLELKTKPEHLEIHVGGACAWNREKTHCVHGHEFSEENTYRRGKWRQCRECLREAQRRYRARKRKGVELAGVLEANKREEELAGMYLEVERLEEGLRKGED